MSALIGLLFAVSVLGTGGAPKTPQWLYPATHLVSAEAPRAPFLRLANLLAGDVPFPVATQSVASTASHAGMSQGGHGGSANHTAAGPNETLEAPKRPTSQIAEATPTISGTGIINTVDVVKRTVNISHQPIAALGWPAMTMDMAVAPSVDLQTIRPGTQVVFTLVRGTDGIYVIDSFAPASGSGAAPQADHGSGNHGTHESMPGMRHE